VTWADPFPTTQASSSSDGKQQNCPMSCNDAAKTSLGFHTRKDDVATWVRKCTFYVSICTFFLQYICHQRRPNKENIRMSVHDGLMIDSHIFDAKHVSQGDKQIVKCKLFNLTSDHLVSWIWNPTYRTFDPPPNLHEAPTRVINN
jgi:hypothetical protein